MTPPISGADFFAGFAISFGNAFVGVQRCICAFHQRLGRFSRHIFSPSARKPNGDFASVELRGNPIQSIEYELRLAALAFRQRNQKFVSAQANRNIRTPNRAPQSFRKVSEHQIACRMSESIVNLFQSISPTLGSSAVSRAAVTGDFLGKTLLPGLPVAESGQAIKRRDFINLLRAIF
jgi:hypothetical protein